MALRWKSLYGFDFITPYWEDKELKEMRERRMKGMLTHLSLNHDVEYAGRMKDMVHAYEDDLHSFTWPVDEKPKTFKERHAEIIKKYKEEDEL